MKDNKKQIITKLIEKGEQRLTIHQLSQETSIRYKNVYDIIKRLKKEGLIKTEKVGNAFQCSLIKKVHPLIFDAEFERRELLTQNNDLRILQSKLNALNFSFIALIFGSYAKGTAAKGSDIDILVIGERNRESEIGRVFSILPPDIHFQFITYAEFLSMVFSNEFSVVKEVIRNNIILIGIEDYYRLMENVGQKEDKRS